VRLESWQARRLIELQAERSKGEKKGKKEGTRVKD
jgi:hypothetical protein